MIHATALTRNFTTKKETIQAVRGIDLDVGPGELVAMLGPNGAGKSTTLRMLTTLLPPTAGSATVAGADIVRDPAGVRSRIGYIGQGNGAGHSYRVGDELRMQGRFYGLTRHAVDVRAGALLESLDLGGLVKRRVSTLSGGQRRRLDVALGLMNDPDLLFLDEPSTGMDPQNRVNLWEHIMRLRDRRGTTIVLTTHYLDEADSMSERVVVVDHGQIIADDTAANLKSNLAGDHVTVRVPASDLPTAERIVKQHAAEGGVEVLHGALAKLRAPVEAGSAVLPALLRELDHEGVEVRTATVAEPTLDDVFLNLTGRSLREGEV